MIPPLLIALIIFILVLWLISFIPVPNSPIPIRAILYIIAIVGIIVYLLRYI